MWTLLALAPACASASAFAFAGANYTNDPSTSWLSYAQFDSAAGGRITMMNATVVVPSVPAKLRGASPSFWFGLQTGKGDGALIQPILAWNQRDTGFGIFHEVFDWSEGRNHQSPEHFAVSAGDVLTQSVSYRASDNSYDMLIASKKLSKSISWNYKLSPKQTSPETTAYVVVEHQPRNCKEYPASNGIDFSAIYVEVDGKAVVFGDGSIWVPKQEKPACSSEAEWVLPSPNCRVSLRWTPD
jgi:hypothetical protein